ncbi:LysR family substrate-binding domain-containing protein [Bacillus sp. 7884-1]|uniref:LysR family substrate-binding domain-containing protein n=1 Tax=Bacillus sp. 7884-1 TaxID=2021693 RepID=UPI000BA5E5A1|nr:LysR family substrate-binding domain-containing protein [Bacillus sp. 7884-1]PAE39101.1 hypothetical protein CHI06_17400 [Bacillus sp. 7884-1]
MNSRLVGFAPFVAALPSSRPLAMDTSQLDIRELKNEPFVMTHRKNELGYYDTIISICNRVGFSPNVIQKAEGIFTILTLISTGLGVSLVTTWRKNEDSPLVDTFLGVYDELFNEANNLKEYYHLIFHLLLFLDYFLV